MSIPLDPGPGGQSIGVSALEVADIIVSTTGASISRAIRTVTQSEVSHALLYVGDGLIVDATGSGVDVRPIGDALLDATLAVAYRHGAITPGKAMVVRDYAGQRIDSGYSFVGILGQLGSLVDRSVFCDDNDVHRITGRNNCQVTVKRMNMAIASPDRVFCSQLVVEAYNRAGVPLTNQPASHTSPNELVELNLTGITDYVGHLKP